MQITGGKLLDAGLILQKAGLEETMHIADLGCGSTGYFVFSAANVVGEKGRVYAVDILKSVLNNITQKARQDNYRNIEIIWSDLEVFGATGIESGQLDIALLINTLYQSKKRAEIIREAVRMLKLGGRLVVVEWKSTGLPFGPSGDERVKQEQLVKSAPRLGLKFEEDFFAGPYHYGLIFTKI